ncbi:diacylglycerol kinase family protein [Pseudidiomarina sp. CB1]|uniref:diacylglycerol/lipid kinase family protein n=1 Tax=Pseudidiomarina sp. CB1 TaxID=2972484 RepID=UPI002163D61B|nr:diacylglycerol kinase family protein [Pseudidiomarina sp. CB1]
MQTTKVLIYVKSLVALNRQKAAVYREFFSSHLAGNAVTLVESSPEREYDIGRLKQWVRRLETDDIGELVVIGGDGSVNIAAHACVNTAVRLSVVPAGTGNDFATALGIVNWRWRLQGEPVLRQRSVGCIDQHIFINHAGAGISVALRELQSTWSKRWLKRYSYLWALVRYLFVRPSGRCLIRDEQGRAWEFQVAAVNRAIGGGIIVYPTAELETQVLGVLQVPRLSRWRQLSALFWILRKQPDKSTLLGCHETATFTLADANNIIELDGDAIELQGPATAAVMSNALNVYTQGRTQ